MSSYSAEEYRVYSSARVIYATQLGIDVNVDSELELLSIADAALTTLPDNYEIGYTDSDYPYFYNVATGESQWTHPNEDYYKDLVREGRKQAILYAYQNNLQASSNSNEKSYNSRRFSSTRVNYSYDDEDDEYESKAHHNNYSDEDNDINDAESSNSNTLLAALNAGIQENKLEHNIQEDHQQNYTNAENENEYVEGEIDLDVLTGCFASYLGIDINTEGYLLSYVKSALCDLPPCWSLADSNGFPYYFHNETGETSWYHPNEPSIKDMISYERNRWASESSARNLKSNSSNIVVSGSMRPNKRVVISDSSSDDDTPEKPITRSIISSKNNTQIQIKTTPNQKSNIASKPIYQTPSTSSRPLIVNSAPSNSTPASDIDLSPINSPIVRVAAKVAQQPAVPTSNITISQKPIVTQSEVGNMESIDKLSVTLTDSKIETVNTNKSIENNHAEREKDLNLVSSPPHNSNIKVDSQVESPVGHQQSSLAKLAFGKKNQISTNSQSPQTPIISTPLPASTEVDTNLPTKNSSQAVASSLPLPKTPPPVSLPEVTRFDVDIQTNRQQTIVNIPKTESAVAVSNTRNFKELILSELLKLDLSLEESELCCQFLHDMCYRKEEVFVELTEDEFKSVLEDPSCTLKTGLKTNLKTVHKALRKEYMNSSKFQTQIMNSSRNNYPDFDVSTNIDNAASENNKKLEFNSYPSIIDDGNSELGNDKQSEIRKRILRRFSSTTQVGAPGADLTQPRRYSAGPVIDPNLPEILKKKDGDNQVLIEQMKELGIQPLQFIPLADIRKEMDELMAKLNKGEAFDDNRFDYLLRCMNINQEYKKEKENEMIQWKNETEPIFNQWYLDMIAFMPSNIRELSISNLVNYGYSKTLATRLVSKECLWLIRMDKKVIAKVHIADLRGKYNYESQKLDIVELAAIFKALPDVFESDGSMGVKSKWKAGLEAKLRATYTQYTSKSLQKDLLRHPAYLNQVGKLSLENSTITISGIIIPSVKEDSPIKSSTIPAEDKSATEVKKPIGLPKSAIGGINMLAGIQNGLKSLNKRKENTEKETSSTQMTNEKSGNDTSQSAPISLKPPKLDIFSEIKLGAGRLKSVDKNGDKENSAASPLNSASEIPSVISQAPALPIEEVKPKIIVPNKPKGGPFGGGLSLIDELKNNKKFKTLEAVKSP